MLRQRSSRRRDGCESWRKRRRDYGGSWGPGQMRRRQVRAFRSGVWRWWRHSVFASLVLLVLEIRAIGCSFTSPRDSTVIERVVVFCVEEYRCVVSGKYYLFLRFLFVPFCVLCFTESLWFYVRFFVFYSGVFLLFLCEIRRTTWKSMFPHRVYMISRKSSSIVDSPCSSISLASRLSHKKKMSHPNESF